MAYTTTTTMSPVTGKGGDQRGFALVTTLLLLAIMSIVASALLTSTSTEYQLAAKSRDRSQALYAADRAVAYSLMTFKDSTGTIDLFTDHLDQIKISAGNFPGSLEAPSTVTALPERTAPLRGQGYSAETHEMINYEISVVGISSDSALNPARVEVVALYGSVVPK